MQATHSRFSAATFSTYMGGENFLSERWCIETKRPIMICVSAFESPRLPFLSRVQKRHRRRAKPTSFCTPVSVTMGVGASAHCDMPTCAIAFSKCL